MNMEASMRLEPPCIPFKRPLRNHGAKRYPANKKIISNETPPRCPEARPSRESFLPCGALGVRREWRGGAAVAGPSVALSIDVHSASDSLWHEDPSYHEAMNDQEGLVNFRSLENGFLEAGTPPVAGPSFIAKRLRKCLAPWRSLYSVETTNPDHT